MVHLKSTTENNDFSNGGIGEVHPTGRRRVDEALKNFANALLFDVDRAISCAKSSPTHAALAWLKTVTNGWCTSSRMHEPVKL